MNVTWGFVCRDACVLNLRRERLCLFFSFLLLLRPALDGDSSFTLPWWDTLDELWELKWVGTCRASPPCEANVALQPPTTHWRNTVIHKVSDYRLGDEQSFRSCECTSECCHLERLVPAVCQHVSLEPTLTGGRCVVDLAAFPQTHEHLCGPQTEKFTSSYLCAPTVAGCFPAADRTRGQINFGLITWLI